MQKPMIQALIYVKFSRKFQRIMLEAFHFFREKKDRDRGEFEFELKSEEYLDVVVVVGVDAVAGVGAVGIDDEIS